MAIMIVALVAIISINMLAQRQLQIYRTANLYFKEQAYQYSLAIESWGTSVLAQDFEREKNKTQFDSHEDVWNTALVDFDVSQATLDGVIFDLQGRFNLNNLVSGGKVQKKWEASYKRLLKSLNLASGLADTLVDWLDSNEQPSGSSGAEDIFYIALDKPYRAANQPMAHISELYLVKGYDQTVINTLKPHVFVVPDSSVPININTSTAKVLQAVIPGLLDDQAETMLSQIENTPFIDIESFLKDAIIQDKAIEPKQVGVISNYYSVSSHVIIDKISMTLQSILYRDKQGGIRVLGRQEFNWYEKNISEQEEKTQ